MLVWLFGPFLSLLEDWIAARHRHRGDGADLGGVNFWLDRRRRKNEAALVQGVTDGSGSRSHRRGLRRGSGGDAREADHRIDPAAKASRSRGYLYEQPWYAIIGPPGAGKTTALLNAGLSFPLAAEMGQSAVAGVGGTRMCDWWFTETRC